MQNNMMGQPAGSGLRQQLGNFYRNQQTQDVSHLAPWQQALSWETRANTAAQFVDQLRLVQPSNQLQQIPRQALQLESNIFTRAQSQEEYNAHIQNQLRRFTGLRQQNMQNNMNAGMGAQMNPAQPPIMGQPGMQGPRPNPPQQVPPGMPNPQLQRPMQSSPLQRGPMPAGMAINTPNALSMPQPQSVAQPNMQPLPQQGQPPENSANQNQQMNAATMQHILRTRPDILAKARAQVEGIPPEQRMRLKQQLGMEPIQYVLRNLLQGPRPAQNALVQNGQAMPQSGPMQMNMNQRQMGNFGGFDANALENQQSEARRALEQGQMVVPATNNANANPPVGFPIQNVAQDPTLQQRQMEAAFQRTQVQNQAQAQARNQIQQQQSQPAQPQSQQQHIQAHQQPQPQPQPQPQQGQGPGPGPGPVQQPPRNPNQMLQGQVGGLHMQPTQSQSPAMPVLTRPLVPPGPPGSTTPQQHPQAHVPQMTAPNPPAADPNHASQLVREAQQRALVAQQGQQPLTEQQRLSMLPPEMPPAMKQQFMKVPDPKFRFMLQQYRRQNSLFPGGQVPFGQPNMFPNAQGMGMGMMHGANMATTPGMHPGQQGPTGMFNPQMPMGQRPGMPANTQDHGSAKQMLQQNPGIIKQTENLNFPRQLVPGPLRPQIPPTVQTWLQLRTWASQNPAYSGNQELHNNLLLSQVIHYQHLQRQGAARGLMLQANGNAVPGAPVQITPGQMPGLMPQQQPPVPNMGGIPVTPQEIHSARQQLPPAQAPNVTDEHLRAMIQRRKWELLRQQRAQVGQPGVLMPGAMQPQTMQPQAGQAAAHQKPAARPSQPPKPSQPNAQMNPKQGVKRPLDDSSGVTDMASTAAPQAPAMVVSRSQQGTLHLTQEQISKLPANQQEQMRAQLLKAQDASNAKPQPRPNALQQLYAKMKNPDIAQRLKQLRSEAESRTPPGQVVHMNVDMRSKIEQALRDKTPAFKQVEQYLCMFMVVSDGKEEVVRGLLQTLIRLTRNFDFDKGTLRDNVTMGPEDFSHAIQFLLTFVGKMRKQLEVMKSGANGQQNQPPSGQQVQPGAPAQLNAANLAIVEQQAQNQRNQNKPPSAPIATRPPFPIGGQSPRGAPTYFEGAPQVKSLKLPDKKRQRLDPGASTPVSRGSPHAGKDASPDKRTQAPPKPEQPRPNFRCKEPDCEYANGGFQTQADLETHAKEAHTKIDDPLQFALDACSGYTGVDPKTGQVAKAAGPKPPATNRTAPPSVKPGQTPTVAPNAATPADQQAGATPMTRAPTLPGVKSSPSASLLKTPQTGTKAATPSTGAPAKATPAPASKTANELPVLRNVELFGSIMDDSYEDVFPLLDNLTAADFPGDKEWMHRGDTPPDADTSPSQESSPGKHTPSTRISDISESDNLLINLDVKDTDVPMDFPPTWLMMEHGDAIPIDMQLQQDLDTLNASLGEFPDQSEQDKNLLFGNSGSDEVRMFDPDNMVDYSLGDMADFVLAS